MLYERVIGTLESMKNRDQYIIPEDDLDTVTLQRRRGSRRKIDRDQRKDDRARNEKAA